MFNAEMLARVKELARKKVGPDARDTYFEGQVDLARDLLKDFPSGAIIFIEDVEDTDEIRCQTVFEPELADDVPPTPAQCVAITVLQQLKPEDIEPEASPAEAEPASISPAEPPPQPEEEETSNE
jgi:hypothetical protein